MKTYKYEIPGANHNIVITKTRQEIVDEYYVKWCEKMRAKFLAAPSVDAPHFTQDNCIEDWCTIHGAWEVKEEEMDARQQSRITKLAANMRKYEAMEALEAYQILVYIARNYTGHNTGYDVFKAAQLLMGINTDSEDTQVAPEGITEFHDAYKEEKQGSYEPQGDADGDTQDQIIARHNRFANKAQERKAMSKVTKVVYTKTKQVRQYEPEKIELEIELGEGDTVENVLARARATVAREWDEDVKKLQEIQERIAAKGEMYGDTFD